MFIFDIITSKFINQDKQLNSDYLFSNTKLNRNIIEKILIGKIMNKIICVVK